MKMLRRNLLLASMTAVALAAGAADTVAPADELVRIVVSPSNPRYFETADGKAWIPIGCNICFDRLYDGNNLWWQFRRFANAIDGLDPITDGFRPFYTESRRLRMYGLRGKKTAILWCRDKKSSWEDELIHGNKPEMLVDEIVPFRNCKLDCYLPWEDRRVTVDSPKLPPFKRSIVVRVPSAAVEGVVRAH